MEQLARPKDDLFESSTMTFGEHLEELRRCLVNAILWLAAGLMIGLFFADSVIQFVQSPLEQAIQNYQADRDLNRLGYEPNDPSVKPIRKFLANNALTWEIVYDIPEEFQTLTMNSIVPTDTGSSTLRRPIYIECVNDKLILRPHQITLAASDFQQPIFAGNPLDAALIAIRDYWQRFDLTGDEGDPYPLLVVRPSGARAYALARHAMQSWQDEFGYELIEEDLPLEFGELDTQLQNEINLAVAKAKQRRANSTHADEFGIPRLGDSTVDSRGNSAADRRQSGGASGRYTGLTVDNENGGFTLEGSTSQQSDFAAYRNSGRNSDHNSDRNAYSGRSPEDDFEPFPTDEEFAAGGVSDSGNWQARNQSREGNTESANRSRGADQESATSGVAGGSAAGNSLDSLAESRGANWALPSRTERGTVYRRPITVYCAANELVVESGTGLDDRRKVVRFDGLTQNAVAPLVAEVWEKIDSWGFAGTGGYWKPELKLNVLPGGLHRANDLRVLLDDSGLDIDVIEN